MTNANLNQLTFEQWLTYVFDRPVDEQKLEWYWDSEADWWNCPAADAIQFMTRAFENAAATLQPYSAAQLNQGLMYIANNACSNHALALLDFSVSWQDRRRCIRSIHNLFEECFVKRCTQHLSHLDEAGAGALNSICYMWWDVIPIIGQPNDPARREMDAEILGVMESTLRLDSIACRESALHGLGHWQSYYPQRATGIIDVFLKNQKELRKELRTYAMSARQGCVN